MPPPWGGSGGAGEGARAEGGERLGDVLERGSVDAGVAADPERALGDEVGRLEAADDAVGDIGVGRLPQQIAAEQLARVDAAGVQVGDQVAAAEPGVGPDGDGEPEPARLGAGRRLGQDEHVGVLGQRLAQEGVVLAPGGDEVGQPVELGEADRRLHVGRLQVVPDVRVDVLVVGAVRERAVLAREAQAARVLGAGPAPAVPAPVAERFDELPKHGPLHEHGAALAERDLVGGVERERRQVAECADGTAVPVRSERVAAVLDQPQVVPLAERRDGVEVERVAERVGDHDGAGADAAGRLQPGAVDVVPGQRDVDEDRDEAVLDDRVHRRREARGDRDDLVAGAETAVAQPGRGEGCQGEQVRGRAGVHEQGVAMPGGLAQAALERLRLGARGEPEIEAGAHELDHLLLAEHAAAARDARGGRVERGRAVAVAGVLGHQVEDAGHAGVGRHLVRVSAPARAALSRRTPSRVMSGFRSCSDRGRSAVSIER